MELSQAQFGAVQDALDNAVRSTKRGSPERAAAEARNEEWEAAIALPQRTAAQRETRLAAIAEVATRLGLV